MKKKLSFLAFILVQLFFVFFYIYNSSYGIKLSYQKQKKEKEINKLNLKKQKLKQDLICLKDKSYIKKYAKENLKLESINLSQVKRLEL